MTQITYNFFVHNLKNKINTQITKYTQCIFNKQVDIIY